MLADIECFAFPEPPEPTGSTDAIHQEPPIRPALPPPREPIGAFASISGDSITSLLLDLSTRTILFIYSAANCEEAHKAHQARIFNRIGEPPEFSHRLIMPADFQQPPGRGDQDPSDKKARRFGRLRLTRQRGNPVPPTQRGLQPMLNISSHGSTLRSVFSRAPASSLPGRMHYFPNTIWSSRLSRAFTTSGASNIFRAKLRKPAIRSRTTSAPRPASSSWCRGWPGASARGPNPKPHARRAPAGAHRRARSTPERQPRAEAGKVLGKRRILGGDGRRRLLVRADRQAGVLAAHRAPARAERRARQSASALAQAVAFSASASAPTRLSISRGSAMNGGASWIVSPP